MTKRRITSYNVCYTKLLRLSAAVSVRVMSLHQFMVAYFQGLSRQRMFKLQDFHGVSGRSRRRRGLFAALVGILRLVLEHRERVVHTRAPLTEHMGRRGLVAKSPGWALPSYNFV